MAACAFAGMLAFCYEIEVMGRNAQPEATIVWNPAQFEVEIKQEGRIPMVWGPFAVAVAVVPDWVLSVVAILLGLKLGQPLGLGWPPVAGFDSGPGRFRRIGSTLLLAVVLGIASVIAFTVALVIYDWVLSHFLPSGIGGRYVEPSGWAGILGSVGAGVREEVLVRLGVMTTIVWILAKSTRQRVPGPATMWSGIVLTSVLFGLGHLPKASALVGLTGPVIGLVLIGNAVVGLFFGWLYWRKGLIAAMTAHTTQDVITHVIRPLIGA
jgi:membrane protease YdiL (CAAX protease family)